jgi:hypothetical protein
MHHRALTATALVATVLTLNLAGCASKIQNRATNAATTPLSDLNLVKAEIPVPLQEAQKHLYLSPESAGCEAVLSEIHALDEVLGPDLDAPPSDTRPSLLERGSDLAEDHAIGALQSTAEGLVPFRGWVRKLSGAERHARHVAAAITAGSIRRAFLKGVGVSRGCSWAPPPAPPAASTASTASTVADSAAK